MPRVGVISPDKAGRLRRTPSPFHKLAELRTLVNSTADTPFREKIKSGGCFPSALSGLHIMRHTASDFYAHSYVLRLHNLNAECAGSNTTTLGKLLSLVFIGLLFRVIVKSFYNAALSLNSAFPFFVENLLSRSSSAITCAQKRRMTAATSMLRRVTTAAPKEP
jgi:hypothetical protein